jgi:hypothetical protein
MRGKFPEKAAGTRRYAHKHSIARRPGRRFRGRSRPLRGPRSGLSPRLDPIGYGGQPAEQGGELAEIRHAQGEIHGGQAADRVHAGVHREQVGVARGDHVGDVLVQPFAVVALDQHIHFVGLVATAAPLHFDHAARIACTQAGKAGTVGAVHRYAATARDETEYRIARQRLAAARELREQIAHALDHERIAAAALGPRRRQRRGGGFGLGRRHDLVQRARELRRAHVAQRQGDEKIVHALQVEARRQGVQVERDQRQALELAFEDRATGGEVGGVVDVAEIGAHFLARPVRVQEPVLRTEPVAPRRDVLAGEDLHALAAARLMCERHDASVHLGAAAAVAYGGMHVIGEIQHGSAVRQIEHLALGGQQVDAILEQIGAEAGEQGVIVLAVLLRLQQLAHPGDLALEAGVAAAAFLVAPVRSHAQLGVRVHVVAADLHFQGLALRPDHGGVQGLVVVALGPRDVIVEFAGNRRPQRVHHASAA